MNQTDVLKDYSAPSTLISDRYLTGLAMGFLLAVLIFFMLYPGL